MAGESIILRSCYIESFKLAVKNNRRTVAFPLISSGAYGYPKDQVLKFAVQTITEFLLDNELMVYICVLNKKSYSFSQKSFNDIKEIIDDNYVDKYDEDLYETYYKANCCSVPIFREKSKIQSIHKKERSGSAKGKSLHEYLNEMDKSFSEMLLDLIERKGITDVDCYKKANITKPSLITINTNHCWLSGQRI